MATEEVLREQKERPPTPFNDPSSNEEEEEDYRPKYKDIFGSFGMRSSQTACNKPSRRPHGTGDDPFFLENLPKDNKEDKARQLKGIHPDKFNGDRSQTTSVEDGVRDITHSKNPKSKSSQSHP